jgi:hypothetical protein
MNSRRKKRVVPQPGGESFQGGDGGPLTYYVPLPPVKYRGRLIPFGNWQIGEAGPPMTPEEYKAYCEREGILDPDRPLIPTIEELAKLPRWARVAFLARCARRVLPICRYSCPTAPASQSKAIEDVVIAAENAAKIGQKGLVPTSVLSTLHAAIADCEVLNRGNVGIAVAPAARVANDPDVHPEETHEAICRIANLLLEIATVRTAKLIGRVRRDFDRVKFVARKRNWTDDTPVSQEVFGPMWPKDLVPDWAKESLQ